LREILQLVSYLDICYQSHDPEQSSKNNNNLPLVNAKNNNINGPTNKQISQI